MENRRIRESWSVSLSADWWIRSAQSSPPWMQKRKGLWTPQSQENRDEKKTWRFRNPEKNTWRFRFSRFTWKKIHQNIAHLNFKENATSEATQTTFHDLWVSTNLSLLRRQIFPIFTSSSRFWRSPLGWMDPDKHPRFVVRCVYWGWWN